MFGSSHYDRGGHSNSHDPYERGHNYRHDNMLNDPYYRRDVYRKEEMYNLNDPYRAHDPYARIDPYSQNKTTPKKSSPFIFWFWLKREIQLIFTSEIGSQDENRVIYTDEDLYRLKIIGGITLRGLTNFFVIPFIFLITFAVLANVNSHFRIIFLFLEIMIVYFWFLFLPTWQVISAGQYVIFRNSINLYKIIRKFFSGYLFKTILGIVIGIVIVSIFVFKPEMIHIKNKYIELFIKSDIKSAWNYIFWGNSIFLIIYFVYYKYLTKLIVKKRKENMKMNIFNRKASDFEKKASILDEELEESNFNEKI